MNEKIKQIFEIIGVEPEEEFRLSDPYSTNRYKFDNKLYIYYCDLIKKNWHKSEVSFADVIKRGIIKIPQKPKLTNKDKIAIKFLKNCGFHYLVKSDIGNSLNAFKNMPNKIAVADGTIIWTTKGDIYYFPVNAFDVPIDDKEPLCLDDFSDEELKED